MMAFSLRMRQRSKKLEAISGENGGFAHSAARFSAMDDALRVSGNGVMKIGDGLDLRRREVIRFLRGRQRDGDYSTICVCEARFSISWALT